MPYHENSINYNQDTTTTTLLRFIAGAIDGFLLFLFQFLGAYFTTAFIAVMVTLEGAPSLIVNQYSSQAMIVGWVFWATISWCANYILLQGLTGSTIGKKICNLKVVTENGSPIGIIRSFTRSLFYVISFVPFLAGFFSILWNQRSQAWHDRLCGTIVVPRDYKSNKTIQIKEQEGSESFSQQDDINRAA